MIKGLEQGKDLKVTVAHQKELIMELKTVIRLDSLNILDKNRIISLLEKTDKDRQLLLDVQEQESKKEKAILKSRFGKRLSFGFSVGAAIKDYNTFEVTPYIGLGLNIRIFRF